MGKLKLKLGITYFKYFLQVDDSWHFPLVLPVVRRNSKEMQALSKLQYMMHCVSVLPVKMPSSLRSAVKEIKEIHKLKYIPINT